MIMSLVLQVTVSLEVLAGVLLIQSLMTSRKAKKPKLCYFHLNRKATQEVRLSILLRQSATIKYYLFL